MDKSPSAVRWYITGVTGVAVLLIGMSLALGPANRLPSRPVVALLLAVAAVLAQRFPIHLASKTKVYVDATILTALALLLPPAAAAIVSAAAVLVHQAILRADWDQATFNVAQTALYVGAGGLVFHALSGFGIPPALPGIGSLIAVVTAVVVMHLLNTLAVAGVVAFQAGESPLGTWSDDLWLDFPEHVALVVLGVLLAALVANRPWLTPLVGPALALVYVSLRRTADVRAVAQATTEAAGDIVDLLTQQPVGHSRRVATWTRRLAEQLGLSAEDADTAVRAAHVHGVAWPGQDGWQQGVLDDTHSATPVEGVSALATGRMWAALCLEPRAAAVARHVRERWDGTGLPDSLAGDAIPIGSRLVAVADTLDRLATAPAPGTTPDSARVLAVLQDGSGRIWDPHVVDAAGRVVEHEESSLGGSPGASPRN